MRMNKILVSIYVPALEEIYDFWIPINKKVYRIILLLIKIINESSGGYYRPSTMPLLYDKLSAEPYDINKTIKDNDIKNGTELVLI